MSLTDLWPAAGVRVRAGDLELRWIDDDLLVALAELASRGVHVPDAMPFTVPWTRGTPTQVARSVIAYQWAARGRVGPDDLRLELAVLVDGVPVGIQGAGGADWAVVRTAETGSWLGLEHQGRGIGTRMRVLMLALLFDGLGAEEVTSAAWLDNPASNAVSRRVGYQDNGVRRLVREGGVAINQGYRMTRQRWEQVREANLALLAGPTVLDGVARLREQLAE
ncbi:MAG TPA: N-acetyltransferase [Micrococcales bacterium]|uniref:GNAT family N-acetyltransferase n=1 Tax=Miniimonas arenae TaxID=676201 RepID=UPI000EC352E8|nr:GNAT family protein [Miniimonas arenae]HCX84263.1 N-acetyltransferase [Micrococcales bacterium]